MTAPALEFCNGRECYSQGDAKGAARRTNRNAYQCRECGHWHVDGSSTRGYAIAKKFARRK